MKSIRLTKGEVKAVSWALYAMFDCWCTDQGAHDRDGEKLNNLDLPKVMNLDLLLSHRADVNADLLQRISEDYAGAADAEPMAVRRSAQRVADSLTAKLTAAGVTP